MTVVSITLTDPVSGLSVAILPADGVKAQVLDVAAPARAVEEDRAGAHGSYDTTRFLSSAAVSLSLLLFPGDVQTPERFLDALGPLLTPALRPYLIVTNDQWSQPRQLTVRFDSSSKPLSDPTNWPVQVSWKAPAGVWEGANVASAVIGAFIASSVGFVFDVAGAVITSAGYVFPATSAPSPSQVVSEGNAPSQWTAFLYGPATAPKFANDTAGLTLEFTEDMTPLGAGEYIALDSRAQTAYRNSDPGSPVLQFLNFSTSNWWLLQPGLNTLRYYPSSASPGAQAALSFRPAWLA